MVAEVAGQLVDPPIQLKAALADPIGNPPNGASEVGFIDFVFGQPIEAENDVAKSSLAVSHVKLRYRSSQLDYLKVATIAIDEGELVDRLTIAAGTVKCPSDVDHRSFLRLSLRRFRGPTARHENESEQYR